MHDILYFFAAHRSLLSRHVTRCSAPFPTVTPCHAVTLDIPYISELLYTRKILTKAKAIFFEGRLLLCRKNYDALCTPTWDIA